MTKMEIWLEANSHKTPKSKSGWCNFFMHWLRKGWEEHRKTIGSNKPNNSEQERKRMAAMLQAEEKR
jgi:hypothetical protein